MHVASTRERTRRRTAKVHVASTTSCVWDSGNGGVTKTLSVVKGLGRLSRNHRTDDLSDGLVSGLNKAVGLEARMQMCLLFTRDWIQSRVPEPALVVSLRKVPLNPNSNPKKISPLWPAGPCRCLRHSDMSHCLLQATMVPGSTNTCSMTVADKTVFSPVIC